MPSHKTGAAVRAAALCLCVIKPFVKAPRFPLRKPQTTKGRTVGWAEQSAACQEPFKKDNRRSPADIGAGISAAYDGKATRANIASTHP